MMANIAVAIPFKPNKIERASKMLALSTEKLLIISWLIN